VNLVNSCNDFGHDDSTINIAMAIINSKRGSCYDQKAVTIFAVSMAHLSTRSHSYLGISPAQILFHAPPTVTPALTTPRDRATSAPEQNQRLSPSACCSSIRAPLELDGTTFDGIRSLSEAAACLLANVMYE